MDILTSLFTAKPFIIAEIGSNWKNLEDCIVSITKAKDCGADAVKFQAFALRDLYASVCNDEDKIREWVWLLKCAADAVGIEFMCSAFSLEAYDAIDPFVSVHKIASSEIKWPQLLEKVKSFGKPILFSIGGSTLEDITDAVDILSAGPPLVLMYCSSAYPSKQYNLFQMASLKSHFDIPVGFSDHSMDYIYPPLSALHHFGAVAIEKHVNFLESGIVTADSPHSLNEEEFTLMCNALRADYEGKGTWPIKAAPEEVEMFRQHNRRLIAKEEIFPGERFVYGENYGAYRSMSQGLPPSSMMQVEKKLNKRRLMPGAPITLASVESE